MKLRLVLGHTLSNRQRCALWGADRSDIERELAERVLPGFNYVDGAIDNCAVSAYGPHIASVLVRLGVPVAEHARLLSLYALA